MALWIWLWLKLLQAPAVMKLPCDNRSDIRSSSHLLPCKEGDNRNPKPSSPAKSPGHWARAPLKAAGASPQPAFWIFGIAAGLELPDSGCPESSAFGAPHPLAWARWSCTPPKKNPPLYNPAKKNPLFFRYPINHARNLLGEEVWGLCSSRKTGWKFLSATQVLT